MANRRREANRGRGKSASYHGSPKETGRMHGGQQEGAGELPAVGPGMAARGVGAQSNDGGVVDAASGKPPKGMSRYSEE